MVVSCKLRTGRRACARRDRCAHMHVVRLNAAIKAAAMVRVGSRDAVRVCVADHITQLRQSQLSAGSQDHPVYTRKQALGTGVPIMWNRHRKRRNDVVGHGLFSVGAHAKKQRGFRTSRRTEFFRRNVAFGGRHVSRCTAILASL